MNTQDHHAIAAIIAAASETAMGTPKVYIEARWTILQLANYMEKNEGCDCERDDETLNQLGHNIWCACQPFNRPEFIAECYGENDDTQRVK